MGPMRVINFCVGILWKHPFMKFGAVLTVSHIWDTLLALYDNKKVDAYKTISIIRDHSFLRHAEFSAEPRHLPVAAEFLCFRWILRNSVLTSNKGTNTAHFGRFQVVILYVYVISAMKYMTADGAVMEGMSKLLIWAYLKYSKFIW